MFSTRISNCNVWRTKVSGNFFKKKVSFFFEKVKAKMKKSLVQDDVKSPLFSHQRMNSCGGAIDYFRTKYLKVVNKACCKNGRDNLRCYFE